MQRQDFITLRQRDWRVKLLNKIEKNAVDAEDLKLINNYTRKELSADEVYAFSVVLCDNDIDRDYEYFTAEALEKLSDMFVGVTGIYDHQPTAKNQVARIYSCHVENMSPKKTAYGDDYLRLVAKAYMPVCEANKDIIAMLDSGIQKEVSVGCAIEECVCSVCGENMRTHRCGHIKGEVYDGVKCCGVLRLPVDAYEWSFTAVPAQKKAGVIKSFERQGTDDLAENFLKKTNNTDSYVTVSCEEIESLKKYIGILRLQAEEGNRLKSVLELETVKSGVMAKLGIDSELLESMVKGLSIEELLKLKDVFERKAAQSLPLRPQTFIDSDEYGESLNGEGNDVFNI